MEKFYWTYHPDSGPLCCVGPESDFGGVEDVLEFLNALEQEDVAGNPIVWSEDLVVIRDKAVNGNYDLAGTFGTCARPFERRCNHRRHNGAAGKENKNDGV